MVDDTVEVVPSQWMKRNGPVLRLAEDIKNE